jgi:predicted DCC family thiol-disulfide oxidoreductase YuxK
MAAAFATSTTTDDSAGASKLPKAAVSTGSGSSPALPAPSEFPTADVVIYDGDCRICTAQVQRLARWDGRNRLAFLSLHDAEVARRYPDLQHDYLMQNMVVVDRQQHRHAGAAAVRYLTRRLPRLWPLAPILHIPFSMPLWHWCYQQIAKRRYLIGGKSSGCDNGACSMHFK